MEKDQAPLVPYHIDAAFPGGNIRVERLTTDTAWLRHDLRDNIEDWFYWNFRVLDAGGQTLHFIFTSGDVFGARGPCFSPDGEHWDWLGREVLEGDSFRFTFPPGMDQAFFAFGVPYTERNLRVFLAGLRAKRDQLQLTEAVLTESEKGRRVELIQFRSVQGAKHIMLTARHHACEGMASYVLEGLLEVLLTPAAIGVPAAYLHDQVDLYAVPFVDKDGVEEGDQGKMRHPHDHWDDYPSTPVGTEPLYIATRALIDQSRDWRGRLALAIDLHCPAMRGGLHDEICVVEPEPEWMPAMSHFYNLLEAETVAQAAADRQLTEGEVLLFDRRNCFPYGVDWNVAGPNCSDYFRNRRQTLAFTLEFPYALAGGKTVTVENARRFGEAVGKAIAHYVEESA